MNGNFSAYYIDANIRMNQLSYEPPVSNELGQIFEEEPDSNELTENTATYQRYNNK